LGFRSVCPRLASVLVVVRIEAMNASSAKDLRIRNHPLLTFRRKRKIHFLFEGEKVEGYENESVAAALSAAGVRTFGFSKRFAHPRGWFCGVGKCSACLMRIDGIPNERTCITPIREGMIVERQDRQGELPDHGDIRAEAEQRQIQVLVIGGGPAGLAAGITAQNLGLSTLIIDENPVAGGQLLKQTHKFFGSKLEYAGYRGFEIAEIMLSELIQCGGRILTSTSAAGYYGQDDSGAHVYLAAQRLTGGYRLWSIHAERIIVTTGASENYLAVPGNSLPGVYGAGGVQALMHIYGVKPGNRALIVGAGNVGLIIGYQLYQAGVEVEALIDTRPEIGGYLVHASKLVRLGVPILLGHTITAMHGEDHVTGASIAAVDEEGRALPGTEKHLEVDMVVVAVGLSACSEILLQAGCRQMYVPETGGWAPVHNENMETTQEDIYVAGDAAGVAEASTAMLEGRIAAARIAEQGSDPREALKVKLAAMAELESLQASSSLRSNALADQRCHNRWEELHARKR